MSSFAPKISVIIPVYNVAQYLKDCLESVLSQTLKEIEILCVNDGSTDKSLEILEKYSKQDQRIKIFSQRNQGLSAARNTGLRQAVGKYISFLDSDDMFADQDVLSALYAYAEEMQTDLVCTDLKVQIEIERQFSQQFYKRQNDYVGVFSGQQLFCKMINQNDFFNLSWLLFLRREWLFQHKITFYPGILYEDILFSFLCYMKADRAAYLKKECYIYRVRENSIMNQPIVFHNLESYLFCYREILKETLKNNWTEPVLWSVKKYLDLTLYNVKYTAETLYNKNERFIFHSAEDEILASAFEIDNSMDILNKQAYFEGFDQLMKRSESIIIYGAGQVGRLVYHYLRDKEWGNKVSCFCVTRDNEDERNLEGMSVKCIEKRERENEDELLIVAVRKNYQREMIETALRLGYRNIVVIDHRLEQMMAKQID